MNRTFSVTHRIPGAIHRAFLLLAAVGIAAGLTTCSDNNLEPAPISTAADDTSRSKVVIFVIDGARYSETFGDSTHTHIPCIWNELRPQGAILTNFRNEGVTNTVPGHSSIVTGTWQTLANNGSERPDKPTLFEYYRQYSSAPDSLMYVISGKTKLNVCAYSTYPGYGHDYGATVSVGHANDLAVYNELVSVLQNQKPRLILACFPGVDRAGHTGAWNNYLASIAGVDSLAGKTWRLLQSDPYYADQTYMFVTNDHGRHDDDHGGFRNHGDGCEGCRRLMFLALGPGVRRGFYSHRAFTQLDICETAGAILDFPTPLSEGKQLHILFTPPYKRIKPEAAVPAFR